MSNPKPINFKPQKLDRKLLDLIKDEQKLKTNADLLRHCIHAAFKEKFGEEMYTKMLIEDLKI